MIRTRLPNRRFSITTRVEHKLSNGSAHVFEVTYGFDPEGKIADLFTTSLKSGSDLGFVIEDACVVLSLLLQHGYAIADVSGRLGRPKSLIGTLASAGARLERALGDVGE